MKTRFLSLFCVALFCFACGDDGDTSTPDITPEDPCAAVAAGELCVIVQVPEDAPAVPQQVSIHFFERLPPVGPPKYFGPELKGDDEALAQYEPGASFPVIIPVPNEGEMFIYGALYMEGGGAQTWQPVADVDFHTGYPEAPIQFTGEPIVLETPLTFSVFTN